ncbi:MAG: GNAT family protein [Pirellulaceae bacterium]
MKLEINLAGQRLGPSVADWVEPSLPYREVMQGRFCKLEPLDPTVHAESLFSANQLDELGANWTYLAYGPFSNIAEYRSWLEQACMGDDPLFFAICDLVRGEAVGVASYLRITPASGTIEIGHLNFSPRLQRTPAATEAMFLMMERIFDLGYRRCEWKCNALNAASRAAAQRLGFSFEGVFRQHLVVKGRNRDSAWYACIDAEWPRLRVAFQTWLSPENFDASGQQKTRLSTLTAPILSMKG